jgi:hypothetical protein
MKAFVIYFLTLSVCFGQIVFLPHRRAHHQAVASESGCTVATGDVINESFEGTGYQNTWTETTNPDEDAALPGTSPCSGLGSQCLSVVFSGATRPIATWDRGSIKNSGTEYYRVYLYIASSTIAITDRLYPIVGTESATSTDDAWAVRLLNNAGQLELAPGNIGSAFGSAISVSTSTWYRVEIKWTYSTAATGIELKVFDAAGTQVGSTQQAGSRINWGVRYLQLGTIGPDNSQAVTMAFDGVGINSSSYLGQ